MITRALTYFSILYPQELTDAKAPAYLSVVNQEPGVKSGSMPSRHMLVSDPAALAAEVVRLAQEGGQNVWNSICAHGEDLGTWHRGKRSEVTLLPALWIDVDLAGPGHAAANLPTSVEDVVASLLVPFGLDPTMVVHSGGGLHVYWCLDALADVSDANRSELQGLLKAWQARFQALAEAKGWHLDNVSDLARVLRPAGTLNRKPGRENPPIVELLLTGGPRYSLPILQAHIGASKTTSLVDALLNAPRTLAVEIVPEEIWSYEATKAEVLGKMRRNAKPERKDTLRQVLDGQSFAKPGDRDRALYQVVSWLSFYCPDGDPEAIADILQPSLDKMRLEAPDPDDYITRENALTKIERCLVDGRAKNAANKAANERIKNTLTRAAAPKRETSPENSSRTANPGEGVVPQSQQTGRDPRVVPPADTAPSKASGTAGIFSGAGATAPVGDGAAAAQRVSVPASDSLPVLDGLKKIVYEALETAGEPLNLGVICDRIDRQGYGDEKKVKTALDVLTADRRIYLHQKRGHERRWSVKEPEAERKQEEQASGAIAEVSKFSTRWTTREDLIAHGREQFEASGVGPNAEDWEDNADDYLAAMALHQTIITTPAGDKFLALPKTAEAGRAYITVAKGEIETNFWRDFKIEKTIWPRSYINSEGESKEKSFRQVLSELSIPSGKWLYDGQTPVSFVDDNGIFHQRCWALEPVEARFDEQCDAYLRTWGEENYFRICDWFAHLKNLHTPSTMLVLQGDSGDGKDLLVKAASSQYRQVGGAVTGNLATDQFNADLSECPVVGCSEMLPSDWRGTSMNSGVLREIITKQEHDVNEKNTRRVKLKGHLRWVLTTNEPNFFPTKEILSQSSQDAILKRLMVVEAPRLPDGLTAPKSHLSERGGFDYTRDWIDGETPRMVAHMRHIMETHKIVYPCPESRFGVASFAGSFREKLAVNTSLSGLIVDGLLRFLLGEASRRKLVSSVRVGNGKVFVQIGELHKQWASLTALGEGAGGSDRIDSHRMAPPAKVFAEEVSQRLATRDDVTIEGKVWKSIRVELLSNHATSLGLAEALAEVLKLSPEEFAARAAAVKTPGVFGGK